MQGAIIIAASREDFSLVDRRAVCTSAQLRRGLMIRANCDKVTAIKSGVECLECLVGATDDTTK